MEKESGERVFITPSLADRLNAVLESTKETVTNLNEALANSKPPEKATPIEVERAPACPDEGKSA